MIYPVRKAVADSVKPVLAVLASLSLLHRLLRPLDKTVVRVWRRPHFLYLVLDLLLSQVRKLLISPEAILLLQLVFWNFRELHKGGI